MSYGRPPEPRVTAGSQGQSFRRPNGAGAVPTVTS